MQQSSLFTRGPAVSGGWPCRLFARDDGAAGVQMVEVEHGVEDQKITAHGFAAPHGIVGKEDDVAPAVGNVHDSGLFGDFVAAGDHATKKQIFFGGEAQDDARLLIFRWNLKAGKIRQVFGNVEFLLVGSAFDRFFRRLVGPGLEDVQIGGGAATARTTRTGGAFLWSTPSTGAAEIAADSDDRTGAEINIQLIVVAVGEGAFLVIDRGEDHAAGGLHGARIGNIHHFRYAASDGQRSAGLHGDEQSAFADEALDIGAALITKAAANVVGGIQARSDKVGSFNGIFPGTRIASHGQAAQHGAQTSGAASAHGRKDDDLKLFGEVRGFAQPGVGDVGVRDFKLMHGNTEPAVVLRVLPIVDESDAGNGERMRLDTQCGIGAMEFDSEILRRFFELRAISVANDK